jgi:hypothetical protein
MFVLARRGRYTSLRVAGQLTGSWAEALGYAGCPLTALDIDLSGVTDIDAEGERSLAQLQPMGVKFRGGRRLAKKLCGTFPRQRSM